MVSVAASCHEGSPPWRAWRTTARCLAAVLLVLVAACRAPPAARTQAGPGTRPAGATQYQLDAAGSQLWFYLHAAGPLVKLRHKHLISSHDLRSFGWSAAQLHHTSCGFELPGAE